MHAQRISHVNEDLQLEDLLTLDEHVAVIIALRRQEGDVEWDVQTDWTNDRRIPTPRCRGPRGHDCCPRIDAAIQYSTYMFARNGSSTPVFRRDTRTRSTGFTLAISMLLSFRHSR